jgi:hypothetical protein
VSPPKRLCGIVCALFSRRSLERTLARVNACHDEKKQQFRGVYRLLWRADMKSPARPITSRRKSMRY